MNHYHVGIIVTDIEAASASLTGLLGIAWGPIMHLDANEYRDEARERPAPAHDDAIFHRDPCLELILEVPGSVWVRNDASNLHHIGFWVDSLRDRATP